MTAKADTPGAETTMAEGMATTAGIPGAETTMTEGTTTAYIPDDEMTMATVGGTTGDGQGKNREDGVGRERGRDEQEKSKDEQPEKGDGGMGADPSLGRNGGIYIPPLKLRQMMKDVEDKSRHE
ncbi:hypothetical protein ACLOJK_025660 [Asimina triloba]